MKIVITGAGKGIGKSIALSFASQSATILVCGRNEESLIELKNEIQEKFPQSTIEYMIADLSQKNDCIAFGNWCLGFGEIDILVNNVGSYLPGNILDEAEGALEKMLQINLLSAYYVTRIIGNEMKRNRRGHVFNITSIAGNQAYENGGSYSISKYAMRGFSDNLRHELKNYFVKVTNVAPGAVMTDSWAGFDNSDNRILLPEDIGEIILKASQLSAQAVVEEIIIRPQLGDL